MVHDCVESGRKIGVCHTVKEIRPAKKQQSKEEALNQNQATYQPQAVFSAGPCEIKDVLDDGRIQASIDMVGRYRLIEEVQTLPYRVVRAERLEDCDAEEDYSEQTQHITALLIELLGRQEKNWRKFSPVTIGPIRPQASFRTGCFSTFDSMRQECKSCSN